MKGNIITFPVQPCLLCQGSGVVVNKFGYEQECQACRGTGRHVYLLKLTKKGKQ